MSYQPDERRVSFSDITFPPCRVSSFELARRITKAIRPTKRNSRRSVPGPRFMDYDPYRNEASAGRSQVKLNGLIGCFGFDAKLRMGFKKIVPPNVNGSVPLVSLGGGPVQGRH